MKSVAYWKLNQWGFFVFFFGLFLQFGVIFPEKKKRKKKLEKFTENFLSVSRNKNN
jgi:hypothetical protein